MNIDSIDVGKTYQMRRGAQPRYIVDIIWHPAGEKFVKEYLEAVVQIWGKNGVRTAKESLEWIAENAIREVHL